MFFEPLFNEHPIKIICFILGIIIVAGITLVSCVFIWDTLGENPSEKLNRLGMIFEVLGVAAIIPEIIGKEKINYVNQKIPLLKKRINSVFNHFKKQIRGDFFTIIDLANGEIGSILILANLISSSFIIFPTLMGMGGLIINEFNNQDDVLYAFAWIIFSAFSWPILLFLVILLQKLDENNRRLPSVIRYLVLISFGFVHYTTSLYSLPLLYAILIFFSLVLALLIFILNNSFQKIITWITLPFILFGNLFQLISTYL